MQSTKRFCFAILAAALAFSRFIRATARFLGERLILMPLHHFKITEEHHARVNKTVPDSSKHLLVQFKIEIFIYF
jgi:hypothetical protein